MWQFDNVKELAFRELGKIEVPPLERLILVRDYDGSDIWRDKAMTALSERPEPLSEEEGERLEGAGGL